MATSSSMRYSVVQADEELLQQTLGIYTKGAMFWGKQSGTFKGDMTVMDALPGNYVITIIGCNSGSKASVQAILTEISNWLNTNILNKDNLKITDFIDVPAIVRLNASYTAKEFSFKFADARGRIYTLTVSPIIYPKAGELIRKECEGKDQWGIFTDGSGGSYRQLIKANSTNCGYVPPEPAGIEKRRFCEDKDQWAEYTDGNYGTYIQLIKTNSTACGYAPPPPAGTLIDTTCEGTTKWGNFTDGAGGTRRELMAENSPDCGYVAPPPGGEPSGTYCQGFDLWGKYTDGNGGFINQLVKENSPDCGYVGTDPAGQLIEEYCVGKDRWGKYTNGNGGFTNQLITANSTQCGGGDPGTGTLQRQYCNGTTLMGVYATGSGATFERAIEQNSAQCTGSSGGATKKLVPANYRGGFVGMLEVEYDPAAQFIYIKGWMNLAWPFTTHGVQGVQTVKFFASSIKSDGLWPEQLQSGPNGHYYPWIDVSTQSVLVLTSQVPGSVINAYDVRIGIEANFGEDAGGA